MGLPTSSYYTLMMSKDIGPKGLRLDSFEANPRFGRSVASFDHLQRLW